VHPAFESAIDDLLHAWRNHHDARTRGAPIPELARNRHALDAARERARFLRRRLSPTAEELAAAPLTTTCDVYGEPVVIGYQDIDLAGSVATYMCVCGAEQSADLVAGDIRHASPGN